MLSVSQVAGTKKFLSPEKRKAFIELETTGDYTTLFNEYKSDIFALGLTFLYAARLIDYKSCMTQFNLKEEN